jgi:hypothetical protein
MALRCTAREARCSSHSAARTSSLRQAGSSGPCSVWLHACTKWTARRVGHGSVPGAKQAMRFVRLIRWRFPIDGSKWSSNTGDDVDCHHPPHRHDCLHVCTHSTATMAQFASRFAVPAGIALVAAQSSLVSVYGGQRAIIFDRFQGVKEQVSAKLT